MWFCRDSLMLSNYGASLILVGSPIMKATATGQERHCKVGMPLKARGLIYLQSRDTASLRREC